MAVNISTYWLPCVRSGRACGQIGNVARVQYHNLAVRPTRLESSACCSIYKRPFGHKAIHTHRSTVQRTSRRHITVRPAAGRDGPPHPCVLCSFTARAACWVVWYATPRWDRAPSKL